MSDSAAERELQQAKGAGEAPRPLRPHTFEVAGKRHVFDPSSGRLFRADAVASDIVALIDGQMGDSEMAAELTRRHDRRLVDESMCEVRRYVSDGKLAAAPFERSHPELQPVTPRIVSVTLNAASVCNLDCIYCWNRGGAYGRMEQKRLMDRETATRAIDLAHANGLEKGDILVDIYGGEPLLNFDVVRAAMEHCKEIEKESGGKRTFSYKVTTNGTLLTPEIVEFLSAMGTSLGISIDGTKKVHNRNRPFPGGGGTWEIIRRNVSAAEGRNIHVSARATLVPPDIDMVKATKALFREGFYDTSVEYASEACQAFKPGGFPAYSDADVEAMKREYLRFAKFYLSYSLYRGEAIDIGLSNNITRVLYETHRFSPCGAGSNFLTVSEDGAVYPCIGFIGMPEYRLGSVSEGIDLDRLAKFRHRLRSVVHEAEDCADCWAKHICQGNCPANNEQHNGDLFKAYRRGCDWLRYKLEVAMWVASELALRKPERLKGYRPV